MPSLIFEQSGHRQGGVINGRVLIGRRLSHGVVIGDQTVSRLHAWIEKKDGVCVLTDAGSRGGTFVNDELIARCDLENGDVIRVGPVKLDFRDDDDLPADVLSLDISSALATVESSTSGILFDCKCGAPLWVTVQYAGKKGICKYCGEPLQVPIPPPSKAEEPRIRPAVPPKPRSVCGACHSPIQDDEDKTACISCNTTFHVDCWQENYGCSTYGCAQVNSLKSESLVAAEQKLAAAPPDPESQTPWELLLLAGSIAGSLIGSVTFGGPPIIVAIAAVVMLARGKSGQRPILFVAVVVSFIGTFVGLGVSDYFWLSGQHLKFLR